MMSDAITLSDDERAFAGYLDSLSGALQHGSRERPFRDYCTGLLLPDGRKSVEPMAARLAPSTTRTTHKRLLNFVSDGAWSDAAVLAAMRREVLPALEAHGAVRRWIVDETGMAKKGTHSVGVARQYCGELGKIENCQVLVSLSVANEVAALPVAARLYLPEAWAGDPARRDAAGVPLDVTFQTKPSIALELIGRALAGGVPPGMVLADEVYGSTAEFRRGVAGLGLDYALAVRSTTLVSPPCSGRRARLWRGQEDPLSVRALVSVRALAARLPRSAWRWITWREGGGPDLTGRFATARVDVEHEGERTLLVEWPVGDSDPVGYWLVTLPRHTPLEALVAAAKDRWWIEQGYRDLKQEVGLGDYEGRGWRGFHHHVTLTLAAYGFLVMRRCQTFQPAGGRAGALSFPVVEDPANPPIRTERHAPFSIPTTRRRLTVGIARRLPRCPCCQTPAIRQDSTKTINQQIPITV
jgi:SRSO17 transposase